MIDMLKRHAIQVLREAGHDQADVARLVGVGIRSVRRVDAEPDVTDIDDAKERERRSLGRPSKAEPFRSVVAEILAGEPELLSVEILRRAKLNGYTGGTVLMDSGHLSLGGETPFFDLPSAMANTRSPGPGRRRRPQGRSEAEGLDAGEPGATL